MSNMFYDMTDTAENIDKVVHELIGTLKEEYVDNIIGIEEEGGVFYLKPRPLIIKCTQSQYETWEINGEIDTNKLYGIIIEE